MKILLVANYEADGQWSMRRFERMLAAGLGRVAGREVTVRIIRPAARLGRPGGGLWKWLGYADKFLLFRGGLLHAAREADVVHILDQGNGIWAGWLPGCIVTVHDLLAVRAGRGEFEEIRTGWTGRVLQRLVMRGLRRAGKVVAVSPMTRRDVERLVGPCELVPNGVEKHWGAVDTERAMGRLREMGIAGGGYVLHVGGGSWYKNRGAVVRAFVELRMRTAHRPPLVLAGPPLETRLAEELGGLKGDVIVFNGSGDEMLAALYSMAGVLLFPSIAEGFGWPIVEAQACGCPVIASAILRETGGPGAVYAGEGEWGAALTRVLEMPAGERARLVEAGRENARRFSAEAMAEGYLALYRGEVL